jgi:hypothetical protein
MPKGLNTIKNVCLRPGVFDLGCFYIPLTISGCEFIAIWLPENSTAYKIIYNMNILLVGFSGFVSTIMMPIPWRTKILSINTLCCGIICFLSIWLSLKDVDIYMSIMHIQILQFILATFTFAYVFIIYLHYYYYIEALFL